MSICNRLLDIPSLMGPSVSVLLGDYWLVKAVELVLGDPDGDSAGDMRVIRLFSKTLSDLAEGESRQLTEQELKQLFETEKEVP